MKVKQKKSVTLVILKYKPNNKYSISSKERYRRELSIGVVVDWVIFRIKQITLSPVLASYLEVVWDYPRKHNLLLRTQPSNLP